MLNMGHWLGDSRRAPTALSPLNRVICSQNIGAHVRTESGMDTLKTPTNLLRNDGGKLSLSCNDSCPQPSLTQTASYNHKDLS
jgi:hypothetical protein